MGEHVPFAMCVWEDAWGSETAEVTLANVEETHNAAIIQTIGWVLLDNHKGVSIANERLVDDGEESYRGRTFIPRGMILSLTPFNLTKPRAQRKPKPVTPTA